VSSRRRQARRGEPKGKGEALVRVRRRGGPAIWFFQRKLA
jgi:hypothetical protein